MTPACRQIFRNAREVESRRMDSDGPVSGRLPFGHSVPPAGVEWVTGPGRRIERKAVPQDVSRFAGVGPGLGTHPHADQSIHRSDGSLSGHLNPRCRIGGQSQVGRNSRYGHILKRSVSFFEPLPPPPEPSEPPARQWSPPAWDRPSEGTLPATLAVDAVLQRDEGIVVAVPHLDVFPNGFRINLLMLLDPHRAQDLRALHRGPTLMPRVGVRFADGRVGGRSSMPGMLNMSKDAEGIPTQPYVGFAGGGGGGSRWTLSVWVYPLPPDGPLDIFVALPAPATQELSTVVDGSAVRAAAERAKVIWT